MTISHRDSKPHSKVESAKPLGISPRDKPLGISPRDKPRNLHLAGGEPRDSFKHLVGHSSKLVMMFTDRIWHPPTDVYETATEVVIKSEIAGVNPDQIKIIVDEHSLTIKGSRSDRCLTAKRVFRQMEINYGNFERVLMISAPIDPAGAHVSYREGFLEVVIPKAQKERVTVTHLEIHFEK